MLLNPSAVLPLVRKLIPIFFSAVLSTWATFTCNSTCCGLSVVIWLMTFGPKAFAMASAFRRVCPFVTIPLNTMVSLANLTLICSFGEISFRCDSRRARSAVTVMSYTRRGSLSRSPATQIIMVVEPICMPSSLIRVGERTSRVTNLFVLDGAESRAFLRSCGACSAPVVSVLTTISASFCSSSLLVLERVTRTAFLLSLSSRLLLSPTSSGIPAMAGVTSSRVRNVAQIYKQKLCDQA